MSGWGKDQFGVAGSYQNVLKEVDVSVLDHDTCQARLQVGQMHCNFLVFLASGAKSSMAAMAMSSR